MILKNLKKSTIIFIKPLGRTEIIMKRILPIILAIVLTFTVLTSCSKDGVPDGMKLASSEKANYTLYVPEDWVIGAQESFTIANSKDKIPNVSATSYELENTDSDLDSWWETELVNLEEGFKEIKVESSEKTTLAGRNAMEKIYTAKLSDKEYKYHQVAAIENGYVYIVTFTSLPDSYEDYKDTFSSILKEFKF